MHTLVNTNYTIELLESIESSDEQAYETAVLP